MSTLQDVEVREKSAEQVIENWLKEFVIKYDLCPFATLPFKQGKVRIKAFFERSLIETSYFIKQQINDLLVADPSELETSLLVVSPEAFFDFSFFLDFVDEIVLMLEESELDEELQLVAFHPNYQFEGETEHGRSNYTNRSPYPMIHLIRQDSMARAIEAFGEDKTDAIPERNIKFLQSLDDAVFETHLKRFHSI